MTLIMGNDLKSDEATKKILVILNPKAGMMHANKVFVEIIKTFVDSNYMPTVLTTKEQGDAMRYATEFTNGMDLVVCIGGDGTLNEVVAGLLKANNNNIPVGYIPSGSTNDFATSIGISKNVLIAAKDITKGKLENLDVGRFNKRYFSYVASFGAFTSSSYEAPQNIKNMIGHTAYVLQGIREIPNIKPERVKIITPEKVIEGNFIFGAICNSNSVGGILSFEDFDVDMNDGKVEVFLIRAPESLSELNSMIVAMLDQSFNSPLITFFSTESVQIEAERSMPWTLDGEFEPGYDEIDISIIHSGINIIVPNREKKKKTNIRKALLK
ncbi:MAG TPA: diacylglycerol kinase family protein [Anaerovoracaceae bacterium]|nr:diacylglycerol kinase family protein [Anaerovoracaceae bacterium]